MNAFLVVVFSFLMSSCQIEDHAIIVEFEIDDKKIKVSNDFEILFQFNGISKEAIVKGNKIILPELDDSINTCDVTFISGKNRLEFKSVKVQKIKPDQDVTWEFRIDNPPFYENYEGVNWSKVKKIHYWAFDPHEFGVGIEIIEPIF